MENNCANISPVVSDQIQINDFDKDEFLITHLTLEYQLKVSKNVKELLALVDGKRTVQDIAQQYKLEYGHPINSQEVYHILFKHLAKYGIIQQEEFEVKKRGKAKYLRLSFELISPKITNYIAKQLAFLFNKKVFYSLIIILPIFISYFIYFYRYDIANGVKSFISPKFIIFFLLFGFWTFFHEFGHASACRKFGVKPGGIGFGFYLFTPVLYSDVSAAWQLKRSERIIVNLAGVYFELVVASILLILFLITRIELLLIIPCFLIIDTLYNFNPLIKYDGYWILSDMLRIPNLHQKSYKLMLDFFRTRKIELISSSKQLFLLIYALSSIGFIFVFIVTIIVFDFNSVIYFPISLFDTIVHIKTINLENLSGLILPAIFYYLTIKHVIIKGIAYMWKKYFRT